MQVFKAYFKVLKRGALVSILITIAVGIGIFSLFKLAPDDNNKTFEETKPHVTIYDNDNSEFSKQFVSYLKERSTIVKIDNTKDKKLDALFYRKTVYIITIPEGYGKSIDSNGDLKIETQYLPDAKGGNYGTMLVDNYINTYKAYSKYTDISESEKYDKINKALSLSSEVKIKGKSTTQFNAKNQFFNCANYIIMTLLISSLTLIASLFNQKDIKRRTDSSTLTLLSYNLQILLGHIVVMLGTWLIVMVMGKMMFDVDWFSKNGLLRCLNIFVFSITTVALAYMISAFVKSYRVISMIGTVLSLGTCFLGGSFVPQQFLSHTCLMTRFINPTFWYVKVNDKLTAISTYNSETLTPIFKNMGIQLIFAAVFAVISFILYARKRTSD